MHTFVEAVRLVSTVPAGIAIAKTLSATYASVRRHLPLRRVNVFNQCPTAICSALARSVTETFWKLYEILLFDLVG